MPEQLYMSELGPGQRDRTWSDRAAWEWTYTGNGSGLWHAVKPDGTDGGEATEEELNSPGFGPFQHVRW